MKVYIVKKCQYLTFESVYWEEILSVWIDYNDAVSEKKTLEAKNDKSWIEFEIGTYTVEEKRK